MLCIVFSALMNLHHLSIVLHYQTECRLVFQWCGFSIKFLKNKLKLEIWDRAQHEAIQRHKSNWKDNLWVVPLVEIQHFRRAKM